MSEKKVDQGLVGNEIIESYITMLQKEPSQELLAVTLTAIRRRMQAGGQMVVAVDGAIAAGMQLQVMETEDGQKWIPAYTGFEEQMKGNTVVMSTFMADIGQLLKLVLEQEEAAGLLINPWDKCLRLNKTMIRIILGTM